MAPSAGAEVSPSLTGTTAAARDVGKSGMEKDGSDSNCKLEGAVLNKGAGLEPPVQAYEDATEVPSEFVIRDPTRTATRGCDSGDDQIPVIDLSPLVTLGAAYQQGGHHEDGAANKVMGEIGKACEKWGFFQAVNHGIPQDLLDRLLEVAHEFFQLPVEEKQLYSVQPGEVEGYGRISLGTVSRMWTDTLRHTVLPKPVPEKDRLPNKPAAYRPVMEEYTQAVENVLQIVWRSLSEFLGLESTTLRKSQEEDWQLIMRVNYYPKCPEPDKVWGLTAHKDFGSITVLLQDEVGGLQVQKPGANNENVWRDVKPRKGSLVISIANQVEILTNGRFKSANHRAVVNRNSARLSIAAFANPGPKCIICPLPELLEKTQELPLYNSLVYGDYIPNRRIDLKAGREAHARYEINRN